MARIDFFDVVILTLSSGSTYDVTTLSASTSERALLDGADGDDDGIVADGAPIFFSFGTGNQSATLLGVGPEGIAVTADSGGTIYLFTNDMLSDGQQVTLTDETLNFASPPAGINPTSQVYIEMYTVQDNGGGVFEVLSDTGSASLSPPPTITDDQDGTGDGVITVGEDVTAEAGPLVSGVFEVLGITAQNEVLINDGGTLRLFSNVPRTIGETFSTGQSTTTFCFAAGTLISTPTGARAVEDLKMNDLVLTEDGRAVPVKWLGQQTLSHRSAEARHQMVRIKAGALGEALPRNDLTLTADHGMVIDGFVINSSALINGRAIDFVPASELEESFKVYHVETENHEVILANGAPTETFVDAITRSHFDNFQEYLDLYGAERIIPEMPRCRVSSARLLPQKIRERIGSQRLNCAPDTDVA